MKLSKNLIRNIIFTAAIAIYVWLFVSLELWRISLKELKTGWGAFDIMIILTMFGLIVSCIGIISGKKVFDKIFVMFNTIYLLSGFYMIYFAWTFYIFKVPTIAERIASTRNIMAFGVLMPLLLFYYLERNKTTKHS